jgi:hypothetical protein
MANWTKIAETAWTKAQSKQWLCALIVYKKGIRVNSDDTMTQLRGAWRLYEFIREYYPARARELRQEYGYSRFYELYTEWKKYEFSADVCIDHLTSDLSNRAMVLQAQDVHDPLPEWRRKFDSMCKYGDVIFTSYDAPEDVRAWAGEGKRLMEKYK